MCPTPTPHRPSWRSVHATQARSRCPRLPLPPLSYYYCPRSFMHSMSSSSSSATMPNNSRRPLVSSGSSGRRISLACVAAAACLTSPTAAFGPAAATGPISACATSASSAVSAAFGGVSINGSGSTDKNGCISRQIGLGGGGISAARRSSAAGSRLTPTALRMSKDAVKAGQTDNNPTKSALSPGGLPTVLLDEPLPDDIYQQAIGRTLAWVGGAAVFAAGLFALAGPVTAEEFVAGYLVEQSLSVDNLFVFLLLFDYFKVPLSYQDRVLNWGIYGAIVMRAVLIGVGAAALKQFHAILLVFAGILVYSSANVLLGGDDDEEEDMSENTIVQFSRKLIDSSDDYDGDRFFTVIEGVKKATPLFICMIAVEISDVVFAVDSIPAVFGVTENPLVVFTSNMFAIMGLRSLYTILSKAASDLEYLEPAVAVVLGFIGSKMIAEYLGFEIATEVALAFVATILSGGIGLSIWSRDQNDETASETE